METITGHHLYSDRGDDIGAITDVLGTDAGLDGAPTWIAVKTGLFSERLVPFGTVQARDDELVTSLPPEVVKSAPKVPVHFQPAGDELDALRQHYGLDSVEA